MRIACGLAYEGTHYSGWQFQLHKPTLQKTIEEAAQKIARHPIRIIGSGRTDSGVHAKHQVMHFDTTCERTDYVWQAALNYHLPSDIQILWAQHVDLAFHSRFSAEKRTYHYVIYQERLPWFQKYTWRVTQPLNVEKMQAAADILIGEHDFSAFRASRCQAPSPVRTVSELTLTQHAPFIQLTITANAFLHHMVRNITSVLVEIGQGKRSIESMHELLISRDRKKGSITAPSQGLYLAFVQYPDLFNLPTLTPSSHTVDTFDFLA
jgi:tRNA pseudouridine38-40 synthase